MNRFLTPRIFLKVALTLGALAGLLLFVWNHPTAREITLQGAANLFGFVTTPFILEATLALLGLVAVMTYNQWRLHKEGDGWVILPEDKKDSE